MPASASWAARAALPESVLSLIIPVLDAGSELSKGLQRCSGADELIVVDGGSQDDSQEVAASLGARLIVSNRGRGKQLALGAQAARGDWFLFIHADTLLPLDWREVVERHVRQHPGRAACFRFELADRAWQARFIERMVSLRIRLLGLPYGDQGLLISRTLYEAVGGYKPIPLMEDVDLVRRIGKERIKVLPASATTSSIRWRRDGWFRRSTRNLFCLSLYYLGVSPRKIARLYA